MKRVHFILYVRDQARSTAFYSAVLSTEPSLNVPGMTELELPGESVLGLMPESGIKRLLGDRLPDPAVASGIPRSELYLVVRGPEHYLARALENGAQELASVEVRDWGHEVGYCLDPDGHVLAFADVSTSITEPGAPHVAPVRDVLSQEIEACLQAFSSAQGAIIDKKGRKHPLYSRELLVEQSTLAPKQVEELRACLLDPKSYWSASGFSRRFPPNPGFVYRLISKPELHLFVDLRNPGWEFFFRERQAYWGFCMGGSGDTLRGIAADLYPSLAGKYGMWKQGCERLLRDNLKEPRPCGDWLLSQQEC